MAACARLFVIKIYLILMLNYIISRICIQSPEYQVLEDFYLSSDALPAALPAA